MTAMVMTMITGVSGVLKEGYKALEDIEMVFILFLLLFQGELPKLPCNRGTWFCKGMLVWLAMIGALHIALLQGVPVTLLSNILPEHLLTVPAGGAYYLVLSGITFLMVLVDLRFFQRKQEHLQKGWGKASHIITPGEIRELATDIRLRKIIPPLRWLIAGILLMLEWVSGLSTAWAVFTGTVVFFFVFWALYRLYVVCIEESCGLDGFFADSEEDTDTNALTDKRVRLLMAQDALTDEEQRTIKKRLKEEKIL